MASLGRQLARRKPIVFQRRHHDGQELARNLGTFQLMMFGVGATIGTGIFFVLSEAIPLAGPAVILSFLLAAVAAGLSALCYAELASSIPVSGSSYSFSYHALGEGAAVLVGGCVLLEYGVAVSAVAVGWSGYFNELLDHLFGWQLPAALSRSFVPGDDGVATGGILNLPAIVLVILCMLLLIRGASESATVNAIMVMVKLGVLTLFIVIGFSAFNADHFDNFFGQAAGISGAAGVIFFSFIGLDAVATASEEVRNPQKAIPRAILGALLIVTVFYVLVCIAGLAAQPVEWFGTPEAGEAGLAKIMELVTGMPIWATILSAGAVISVFSVTLVTLYGQTRILFSISRDGMVSKRFLQVSPKYGTPVFNTIVVSLLVALVAGFVPSDYLWDSVSFGTLVAFSVVAISLMVLRRRNPELERPFRVPLYPVVPILTVVVCVYVLTSLRPITWIICVSWLAVVFVFYLFYGRRHATLGDYTSDEQIAEPIHPEDER
ncbi:APC family permease [Microbacterium flavum]|uniref:Amino acid permease n=1 Tax=Microbacterium flavum TaxID=415216 RepID=A0ABS5XXJ3_9MICO|nr:amino acid permease [Microbacterium flavum]MBT8799111.1 amino acid permease [Microbacterium flavum]